MNVKAASWQWRIAIVLMAILVVALRLVVLFVWAAALIAIEVIAQTFGRLAVLGTHLGRGEISKRVICAECHGQQFTEHKVGIRYRPCLACNAEAAPT